MLRDVSARDINIIEDEEFLLRRVPLAQATDGPAAAPLAVAFAPSDRDADGISLYRETMHSPEEVAAMRTMSTNPIYIARIRVGDVREGGMTVRNCPLPDQAGHVVIPELNAGNRRSHEATGKKEYLARVAELPLLGPLGGVIRQSTGDDDC